MHILKKLYFHKWKYKTYIFTPLSSEKYKIRNYFFFFFTLMVKGKQLKFCKICISSIESDVHNKKKIQMFVVNMTFISSRQWMKYTFFHFTRWNKSHIHSKHLNSLYIFHYFVYNKTTCNALETAEIVLRINFNRPVWIYNLCTSTRTWTTAIFIDVRSENLPSSISADRRSRAASTFVHS